MSNCKPTQTLIECVVKLLKFGDGKKVDPTYVKSLVGSLRYLTCTRLDILFIVGLINHFIEVHIITHLKITKRILHCIIGTIDLSLLYSSSDNFSLVVYCDSD